MQYKVKILMTEFVTHDVKRFILEKPDGFKFVPGHSIMISLLENEKESEPFTFTSTNSDNYLEFLVKMYPERKSFNNRFDFLKEGDFLILSEMFGSIRYNGPGLFIAAGIGIVPFLAILRDLKNKNISLKNHILIHSVKTLKDVLYKDELVSLLCKNYIVTLSQEKNKEYNNGRISSALLKLYLDKKDISVIGSEDFMKEIKKLIKTCSENSEQQNI